MGYLYDFLTWMMDGCYRLCHNYGAAVVLFTFLSRIVLIPVTVWTYRNSVTMMKMQADISALKVRYYGNRDILAQKQAELFKENRYHPLSVSLPLLIQLVLLAGVVGTVRAGMENFWILDRRPVRKDCGWHGFLLRPESRHGSFVWRRMQIMCYSPDRQNITNICPCFFR